ncbi:molybdate ABC transporter substrate-binding protein [Paenibacillus sp. J5C2022]|uniref:molybdate ABC transporter substrate-binding protein n=1 Tax=Paenibacillus sp. J5C2022 TaxID=2977129 RepID=UPI00397D787B
MRCTGGQGRKLPLSRVVLLPLIAIVLLTAGCGATKEKKELTISAAASLTNALQHIQQAYERSNPDTALRFNFGGSGALREQIRQGAPVDLFLSASSVHMDKLQEEGIIHEEGRINLLTNELVLVIPKQGSDVKISDVNSLTSLTGERIRRIAIGIPDSVPAGKYAEEALLHAGLWDLVKDRLVQGKDVRSVLHYVETGNADAGFVYRTDALISDNVQVAFTVEQSSYTPIFYPAAILKSSKHTEEARRFLNYLQSEEASAAFQQYGFRLAKDGS